MCSLTLVLSGGTSIKSRYGKRALSIDARVKFDIFGLGKINFSPVTGNSFY
jgi:hypothetical protein